MLHTASLCCLFSGRLKLSPNMSCIQWVSCSNSEHLDSPSAYMKLLDVCCNCWGHYSGWDMTREVHRTCSGQHRQVRGVKLLSPRRRTCYFAQACFDQVKWACPVEVLYTMICFATYFCYSPDCRYFETSCATGEGVEKMFIDMLTGVMARKKQATPTADTWPNQHRPNPCNVLILVFQKYEVLGKSLLCDVFFNF